MGTTRAEPPRLTAAATLPYGELARAAPVAVVVGALSGLISSSFYALVPAWMQDDASGAMSLSTFITRASSSARPIRSLVKP